MKQKIIIGIMILLIGAVIVLIVKDLFKPKVQQVNPWVYDIEEFKQIDETKKCFEEIKRFTPSLETVKSISIDENDNVFLGGKQKVIQYNSNLELIKSLDVDGEVRAIFSKESKLYFSFGNHVEVYDYGGEKLEVWSPYNSKSVITSITVKGENAFVADAGNKILLKYNLKGKLLQEIGQRDSVSRPKGFVIPSPYFDVALGRQGEIWAVNSGLHQFEAYNEQGELFSSWKRTSMKWDGFSGCCNPSHIALLSDGSFVTSEKGLVRIKIHSANGDFKCVVAVPSEFNDNVRGIDLAVDSEDRIYAIVPDENQLRIYQRLE